MPRRFSALLPPLELGSETVGRPISRLGKSHCYKQSQLAAQIGISNRLVSDCEYRRLPLNDELVVRFALALHVSTDEFLGLAPRPDAAEGFDGRIMRRVTKIEQLPVTQLDAPLRTIDDGYQGYREMTVRRNSLCRE